MLRLIGPLVASTLLGCASFPLEPAKSPSRFVRATPVAAQPGPPDEVWLLASIHNHSVWNFEWIYDDASQMVESERLDVERFEKGWYHEMRNLDPRGYEFFREEAGREGVDVAVFTEHNTMLHAHLPLRRTHPELFRGRPLLVLNATEWTASTAHLTIMDYQSQGPEDVFRPSTAHASAEEIRETIAAAHDRGGYVVMNHPKFTIIDNIAEDDMGSDACEVMGNAPGLVGGTRPFWHGVLASGRTWTAVASSDWHYGPALRFPPFSIPSKMNLVRVPTTDWDERTIFDAVRRGHVQPTEGFSKSRRLLLGVDVDGDGEHEDCRAGDRCVLRGDATVQIRAKDARDLVLTVISDESEHPDRAIVIEPVSSDEHVVAFAVHAKDLSALGSDGDRGHQGFIRAELWDGGELVQLSNPIYFLDGRSELSESRSRSRSP